MQHSLISGKNVTRALIGVLAVGVWAVAVEQFSGWPHQAQATPSVKHQPGSIGTVDARRINFRDKNGTTRVTVSNANQFPRAFIRGKHYKRSTTNMSGFVLYAANGTETGGLGTATVNGRREAMLDIDYVHQPTDGVQVGTTGSLDGKNWTGGLTIHDERPYRPGPIGSSEGTLRISLNDHNRNAELIIRDEKGRPRIKIGVGVNGKPHIEMLNAAGKVVYHPIAGHATHNK